MDKINVFVINTPFQQLVVKSVIDNFFIEPPFQNIVIVSTRLIPDFVFNGITRVIENKVWLGFTFLLKIELKKIDSFVWQKDKELNFFLPHLNNVLSSHFFNNYASVRNCFFNVYYEGIAQFYDPEVKIKLSKRIAKRLTAFFLGLKYKEYNRLYPKALRDISCAYTPNKDLCSSFLKKTVFTFTFKRPNAYSSIPLVIGSPIREKNDYNTAIEKMEFLIKHKNYNEVVFKPHFETKKKYLKLLISSFRERNVRVRIVEVNTPLELIMEKEWYRAIFFNHFSSSVVNLMLGFKNENIEFFLLGETNEIENNIICKLRLMNKTMEFKKIQK